MSLESKRSSLLASHTTGLASRKETLVGPKQPEPYFTDEKALQKLIEQQRMALSYYAGMAQSFKTLELEPINMEILQKLQDNNLNEFKQKFFARIEAELDKAGIRNEQIRINLREGTGVPWDQFTASIEKNNTGIQRVRGFFPDVRLDMNFYSIENEIVMFTEADQDRARNERASVYLDSVPKERFAMLVETIIGDLNKLRISLKENGIKETFGYANVLQVENTPEGQIVRFNKSIVNHIIH